MKEKIIVSGHKYSWTDGEVRKQITKKQADKIFRAWIDAGRTINRQVGMGGRVMWVWPE